MATGKKLSVDAEMNLVPSGLQPQDDPSLVAREVLVNEMHCGTCDLHLQSAAANGTDSASELLKMSMENGLYAISITDRETMEGVKSMLFLVDKLMKMGVEVPHFIRGIEITARCFDQTVDILAYFPLEGSEPVLQFLEQQRQNRRNRNLLMCEKLQECGLPVTIEELEHEGAYIVGRMHAANILVRKGLALTRAEAFHQWLDVDKPCYVPYDASPIEVVIKSVREARGVPVLSSPFRYGWLDTLTHYEIESRVAQLQEMGLLGIETVYSRMNELQLDTVAAIARNLKLLATTGSGYMGYNNRDVKMFRHDQDFSRWIP